MLDLDLYVPFVTSNPALGGVCNGLGLAPRKFETVIGVAKAYTTRVGGSIPHQLNPTSPISRNSVRVRYDDGSPETHRLVDMVALNYANKINGFTHLNITKLDVLSEMEELKIGARTER